MKRISLLLFALVAANILYSSDALDNGLALTPPMGWMTWERFRCNIDCKDDPEHCISEHLIRTMADRLVDDGYLALGYEYIMVDDCWSSHERDANSRLQPDPVRFPSGIRALADYVHERGLKFGIYGDYGTLTCGGYPGSIDYLKIDADTFANWTVDYLKLDGCYANITEMNTGYPLMGKYLNETNRPIVYSCSWPAYQEGTKVVPDYKRIAKYCNLWRNYDDIDDHFASVYDITEWYAKKQDILAPVHGPGQWNDPDMLIIGNFGLSYGQSKAQMALWSILSAPLIQSVDLRTIDPWLKEILQNKNMIAINQDPLGIMGRKFDTIQTVEMWSKPLANDLTAFVFLYTQPYGTPIRIQVSLNKLGLIRYPAYNLYESFTGDLIGNFKYSDSFNATINPSGSVFAFWAEPVTYKANKFAKKFSQVPRYK